MKCEDCDYKIVKEYQDYHAHDVPDKKMKYTVYVDYCTEHQIPCDEAYRGCPYREIKVEAQDIEHAINLLCIDKYWEDKIELAIDHLTKILKGEDL